MRLDRGSNETDTSNVKIYIWRGASSLHHERCSRSDISEKLLVFLQCQLIPLEVAAHVGLHIGNLVVCVGDKLKILLTIPLKCKITWKEETCVAGEPFFEPLHWSALANTPFPAELDLLPSCIWHRHDEDISPTSLVSEKPLSTGISCSIISSGLKALVAGHHIHDYSLNGLIRTANLMAIATATIDCNQRRCLRPVISYLCQKLNFHLSSWNEVSQNLQADKLLCLIFSLIESSFLGNEMQGRLALLFDSMQLTDDESALHGFVQLVIQKLSQGLISSCTKFKLNCRLLRLLCVCPHLVGNKIVGRIADEISFDLTSFNQPSSLLRSKWESEWYCRWVQHGGIISDPYHLATLLRTISTYKNALKSIVERCKGHEKCTCANAGGTPWLLKVFCCCAKNDAISCCLFALQIPHAIVNFVVHILPSNLQTELHQFEHTKSRDIGHTEVYQQLNVHQTPLTPRTLRPTIPKLRLTGLAPPVAGYGISTAGESPLTTGNRCLNRQSHRTSTNKNARRDTSTAVRSWSGAKLSPPQSLLSLSSQSSLPTIAQGKYFPCDEQGFFDSAATHQSMQLKYTTEGRESLMILALVFLAGIVVTQSEKLMIPCAHHNNAGLSSMVLEGPASLARFLKRAVMKSKQLFTIKFLFRLINTGKCFFGRRFEHLFKLLDEQLFVSKDEQLNERLGFGAFSSVWSVTDPEVAVKVVTFPDVADHPIWFKDDVELSYTDEDKWAHWDRIFTAVWTEIECLELFSSKADDITRNNATVLPVCRLFDFGVIRSPNHHADRCSEVSHSKEICTIFDSQSKQKKKVEATNDQTLELATQTRPGQAIGPKELMEHRNNLSYAHDNCIAPDQKSSFLMDKSKFSSKYKEIIDLSHSKTVYDDEYNNDSFACWILLERYPQNLLDWRHSHETEMDLKNGRQFLWTCLNVYAKIINGLLSLHHNNLIHFDIKCHNILIKETQSSERVAIIDFGEARFSRSARPPRIVCECLQAFFAQQSASENMAADKIFITSKLWSSRPQQMDRGTELVKSPESLLQLKTRLSIDSKDDEAIQTEPSFPSDVWSLGCLLYELLTGQYLYAGEGNQIATHESFIEVDAANVTTLQKQPQPPDMHANLPTIEFERRISTASAGEEMWWCLLYLRLSGKAGLIPSKAKKCLHKVVSRCVGSKCTATNLVHQIIEIMKYALILDPKTRPTISQLKEFVDVAIETQILPLLFPPIS